MSLGLMLAACTSGTPSTTTFPPVFGSYTGTVTDSAHGSGTATFLLQQSGPVVSGTITPAQQSGLSGAVNWRISTSGAISGTIVAVFGSVSCTFNSSATASGNTLDGTYSASGGCAGENGTFNLMFDCPTGHGAAAIRPFFERGC